MATKKNKSRRHRDALKRARQSRKRNLRNRSAISAIKTLIKNVSAAPAERRDQALRAAISAIDKAGRKRILHHRTASRLVGRLTRRASR